MADEPRPAAAPAADAAPPRAPAVDVAALAERVYRLLLEDLRLERARAGGATPHREARR